MSDIVERLREMSMDLLHPYELYAIEAADEIERLRAILRGIAEYCSGDGQPLGAIERLVAIRNTAEHAAPWADAMTRDHTRSHGRKG